MTSKIKNVFKQMEVFRATSAMPFVSKMVELNDQKYLDGGISDSIPVEKCKGLGYDKIIVELKAVSEIKDVHKAQVRNYLAITGYELGILCNFNEVYMEPVRIINTNS